MDELKLSSQLCSDWMALASRLEHQVGGACVYSQSYVPKMAILRILALSEQGPLCREKEP